jgi:hypothetical protein
MVLSFALAVLLAGPALAQDQQRQRGQGGQRGQRGGGMGGIGRLIGNESVQKELNLDPSQVEKAQSAVREVREKHRDEFAKLRDLSQEERRDKMRDLNRSVGAEENAALDTVLRPEQMKRLKQIELQQMGAQAFARAEVEKALNLTDDQKSKIKTINDDAQKEMRELFQAGGGGGGQGQAGRQGRGGQGGGGQGANREKIDSLRKETMEKVQSVLTEDQKKSWKELTGTPFHMQMPERRPNRAAS